MLKNRTSFLSYILTASFYSLVYAQHRHHFSMRQLFGLTIAVMLFGGSVLNGQSAISPDILRQMSPSQVEALRREYEIESNSSGYREENSSRVGAQGEPLTPIKTVYINESDEQLEEDGPLRYGNHLFDKEVSTFAPVDNMPVPDSYLLGPGDTLNITMFGKDSTQFVAPIDREGSISFPRLGSISLTGLRFSEAKRLIEQRVARQMIGTEAIVSLGQLRSISVFMAGEVRTPGSYSISALSTLTQALYVAGGITDIGSFRNIEVRRDNKLVSTFDVYDLMLYGNSTGDARLQSGDVVFVPMHKINATVLGSVRREAHYEMVKGETLSDLLAMAGGVSNSAFLRNVRLTRYIPGSTLPVLSEIDLTKPNDLDITILDGDVIEVDSIATRPSNSINLQGALVRPGIYAWEPEVRISDFIVDPDADLVPNTDLQVALIVRRRNDRLEIDVESFRPSDVIESPKTDLDPLLKPFDEVIFFSLPIETDILLSGIADFESPLESTVERSRTQEQENLESDIYEESYTTDRSEEFTRNRPGADTIIDESTFQDSSRTNLLESVIARLKSQAGIEEQAAVVQITGAVRVPGEYPLLKNNSLLGLIDLAGGLKDEAYLEMVEIRRIDSILGESAVVRIVPVDLNEQIKSGSSQGTLLQSRDSVMINSVPNWNPRESIIVEGEVQYPGEFLISPGETLGSIIRRAGGLTSDGFAAGAIYTRESVRVAEQLQLRSLTNSIHRAQAAKALTAEDNVVGTSMGGDTAYITEALESIESEGRLVIDLVRILEGDTTADILVQDQDSITIPQETNAITVVGEVQRAGSFQYQEGMDHQDYIDLAAGYTSRSDRNSVYVVKANGRVSTLKNERISWIRFEGTQDRILRPGDTIVVPINQDYKPTLSRYREISTVLFQSIASLAGILSLRN